jgi:hypothetical protein
MTDDKRTCLAVAQKKKALEAKMVSHFASDLCFGFSVKIDIRFVGFHFVWGLIAEC